jgi:hypothetical protein
LWVLLTAVVVGITTLCDMDTKQLTKRKSMILLTLQDAYSLSKGSMVRLMGVPIGYVDNVKLATDNSVIVLLKLDPDIPSLPAGAKGTVVAYGLGGSKSLDFELPSATEKQAGTGREAALSVSNPLRQKALLQAQMEVAKTLEAGANSLADSLSHFPTFQQQGNIAQVREESFHLIQKQEQFIASLLSFKQQLSRGASSAQSLVDTFRAGTEKTDDWFSRYNPRLIEALHHPVTLPNFSPSEETLVAGRSLLDISQGLKTQIQGLQMDLKPFNQRLLQLESNIKTLKTHWQETSVKTLLEPTKQGHQQQRITPVLDTPIEQELAPTFPDETP